ncbi:MAG: SDR family oxidoreductase [Alphaproteobacteria bacterium]|jgi:NAD(P)-dependent dehydrogenase (short-subunit alcohol dehydrogenase family)|nr:SDR family oxidoreductase [Alphaproteobacteria bacterium]MDP7227441.1 SDR family oxidoreductase [Alphaproteobacteria bacterium]MDP7461561.1 SDR family oxidoreductase [Alphaproteobacteria bacterium]HJM92236.1 SDR family oxidoreductase [Alphaproteobacteria bacterium]|tara:strand:- start:1363 stop:2130 length:768 start_codon:yes stop_codon:yes gene_type:complete
MSGVLVVTGASRGIGAACAILGAGQGYKVCVNYNASPGRAKAVVAKINAAGGQAIADAGNMGREADIIQLFKAVDQELGPVSTLINNAGKTGDLGRLDEMAETDRADVFRLNLIGPFVCSREAVKRMSIRHGGQGGVIVNVTSAAARLGGAGQYLHYAASKGGLETFTKDLGLEVAMEGIRVVGLQPGVIDTEIHARMGLPDRVAQLAPTVPMGRAGTSEEMAKTALWLISDAASYINATTIEASGGRQCSRCVF